MSGPVDFVVSKKRKRSQAIDPCLGSYDLPPPSPPPIQTEANPCAEEPLALPAPGIEGERVEQDQSSSSPVLAEPSDPPIVTVDAFLRWSAQKPLKKYSARKRARRARQGEDDASYRPSRSSSPQASSSSPSKRPTSASRPTKAKRNRRVKPLAQRLMEEAVRMEIDVDDNALPGLTTNEQPAHTESGRVELPLVEHDMPPKPSKPRGWTLVDPHRTAPFRDATFNDAVPSTPKKPLTSWNKFPASRGSPRKRPTGNSLPRRGLNPPPLSFIPFEDAERSYAERRRSRKASVFPCVKEIPSPKKRPTVANGPQTPPAPVIEETQDDDPFAESYNLARPATPQPEVVHQSAAPATPAAPQSSEKAKKPLASLLGEFLGNIKNSPQAADDFFKSRRSRPSTSVSPLRRRPESAVTNMEDVVMEEYVPQEELLQRDEHGGVPLVRPDIVSEMHGISPRQDNSNQFSSLPSTPPDFVVTLHNQNGHVLFSPGKIIRIPCHHPSDFSFVVT
ncbi:hypothetical protein AX16_002673 [Volvariella volvacea WC 439]|nr:hypothetical protein AX16_002673 [Volvariella volvacea WC 439]